jgi:hypothetical protein
MSSFTRRIQRQVSPSAKVHPTTRRNLKGDIVPALMANPARKKFFGGRGSKLGVKNPKDVVLIARLARDKKWGRK